jgi:hypothetical protein
MTEPAVDPESLADAAAPAARLDCVDAVEDVVAGDPDVDPPAPGRGLLLADEVPDDPFVEPPGEVGADEAVFEGDGDTFTTRKGAQALCVPL